MVAHWKGAGHGCGPPPDRTETFEGAPCAADPMDSDDLESIVRVEHFLQAYAVKAASPGEDITDSTRCSNLI